MRNKPKKWTQEEKDFIKANYIGCGPTDMAKKLEEKFGQPYTRNQVKTFYANRGLSSGLTGWFVKGETNRYIDPLAGRRPGSVRTHFKKGQKPVNTLKVGDIRLVKDKTRHAYYKIKIAEPNKWKLLHLYNWEKVNGPLEEGKVLVFLDGNSLNSDISNLREITRREHALMNTYGIDRNFGTDENLQACLRLVNLKSAIYKKRGELKKKHD